MKTLVKNHNLKINYERGKGAWTYHLVIPNTAEIKGKWGSLKVSGKIDDYVIDGINLTPRKSQDKMISINKTIREAIKKTGGDDVIVTLHLHDFNKTLGDDAELLECFKDAGVLEAYNSLSKNEKKELLKRVTSIPSDEQQIREINQIIIELS